MELLYVWIKDYKNIKEQGFNFSPKWRFHYDPKTGELDVEDRRDKVIDNFFGDHISNVTAIVGENGSGKSSLLEFIMMKFYKLTGFWDEPFIFIILIDGKKIAWKYVDLKLENKEVIVKNFKMREGEDGIKGGSRGINEFDDILCVYYSNYFHGKYIFEKNGRNDHFFDQSTEGLNGRATKELLENQQNKNIPQGTYFLKELQKQIKFIGEGGNSVVGLKLPTYLKTSGNYSSKNIQMLWSLENKLTRELSNAISGIEMHFINLGAANQIYAALLLPALYEACSTSIIGEDWVRGIYQKIQNEEKVTYHSFEDIETIYMVTHSVIIEFVKWAEKNILGYYDSSKNEFLIPLSEKCAFEFIDKIRFVNYQFVSPFEYSWHFEESTEDVLLSSGETSFLSFFSRLYALRWQIYGRRSIFLFIDEGDLSYHPQWQRKLLKLLLENLPYFWGLRGFKRGEIQIILTSHSPFLLSDLPKENVIFLKKDENGECQVVDGLHDMKQTFGANIHTLLSDGFFMDGFVGDFAKEKIDMVIRYLNNEQQKGDDMNDEKAEKIINMIGEPIVKRQLMQQFQYKKQNKEIEDLKKRIADLEKKNND